MDRRFFFRTIEVEGVQPLEGGAFRLKFRRDDSLRASKLENPLVFILATPRDLGQEILGLCADVLAVKGGTWTSARRPDRWTQGRRDHANGK